MCIFLFLFNFVGHLVNFHQFLLCNCSLNCCFIAFRRPWRKKCWTFSEEKKNYSLLSMILRHFLLLIFFRNYSFHNTQWSFQYHFSSKIAKLKKFLWMIFFWMTLISVYFDNIVHLWRAFFSSSIWGRVVIFNGEGVCHWIFFDSDINSVEFLGKQRLNFIFDPAETNEWMQTIGSRRVLNRFIFISSMTF